MKVAKGLSVSFNMPKRPWIKENNGEWRRATIYDFKFWRIYRYDEHGKIVWRSKYNWSKSDVADIVSRLVPMKGWKIRAYPRLSKLNRS